MDANIVKFLAAHHGKYSAKHENESVYVGRDMAERWAMYWHGDRIDLTCGDTVKHLEDAEKEAPAKIDNGKHCKLKMEWSEVR